MCFDPVSATGAAAGSVLSGLGQMQNNKAATKNYVSESNARIQQMQQDAAEAVLRNKILGEYTDKLKVYAGENAGVLGGVTDKFTAPAQAATLGAAGDKRTAAIEGAIGAPQADVTYHGSASGAVGGDLASRMATMVGRAKTNAVNQGKVNAYGDAWGVDNGQAVQDSARRIDTTNNFARGDISTLGPDQDLQAFQMRKPIYAQQVRANPGATLQGVGSLIGSLAGAYGSGVMDRTDARANIIPGYGGSVDTKGNVTSGYANRFFKWAGSGFS